MKLSQRGAFRTILSGLACVIACNLLLWMSTNNYQIENDHKMIRTEPMAKTMGPRQIPSLLSILEFEVTPNETRAVKIFGDASFLLDYAIIGFPKCGTTALAQWLGMDKQVKTFREEVFALMNREPERFVWRVYAQLNGSDPNFVRGYKNPLDIRAAHSLEYLGRYFPNTVLIIGIRHPVRWFESLYNFKVQNLPAQVHPSYWGNPNDLINACLLWNDTNCVGTAKGYYHIHLAALGKTKAFPAQWRSSLPSAFPTISSLPNPVFLYEFGQLSDDDPGRTKEFRATLRRLVGLDPSFYWTGQLYYHDSIGKT